jgi:hypothetical protein
MREGRVMVGPEPREPLYLGGKRRPGRNLWGFDPFAPRLEPPQRADNAHHINREAYGFWTSPETLRDRRRLVHQLARRKRVGTREAPVRRKQGCYAPGDLEVRKRDLYAPAAEGLLRLLAWCAWHSDWRSSKVGLWIEGRIRYQSRASIADRSGFPVRVDEKKRVRADQLDHRIEDAIVAGLLFRHEEEDGTMTFKVTRLFWILSGVQRLRERYGQDLKKAKNEKARERAAALAYEQQKAERRGQQSQPDYAAFLAQVAAATTNDSDYHARGAHAPDEARRLREAHGIRPRGGGGKPPS